MLARQKKGAGGRVDAALERSAAAASAGALLGPPAVPRMVGCVGCFWVLLSSCLVAVCSFSFLSPAWIVKERGARRLTGLPEDGGGGEVSFGLLWHCAEPWRHVRDCYTVGGLGRFSEIPSGSWQVSWRGGRALPPSRGSLGRADLEAGRRKGRLWQSCRRLGIPRTGAWRRGPCL